MGMGSYAEAAVRSRGKRAAVMMAGLQEQALALSLAARARRAADTSRSLQAGGSAAAAKDGRAHRSGVGAARTQSCRRAPPRYASAGQPPAAERERKMELRHLPGLAKKL
jgi:hypothetical protein